MAGGGGGVSSTVDGLTVLVMSDLHATSRSGDKADSWITTTTPRTPREHPILGLASLLADEGIKPDLILVAGDIADKADETALRSVWSDINDLVDGCGSRLIATAGNHDLDSRLQSGVDPRGALYDLDPKFPANDDQARSDYWSKNYAIIDSDAVDEDGQHAWRVVSLNSSAFHGYVGAEGPELEHGRVSERTTQRLADELEKADEARVKILLVHHHLVQLPDVDLADKSVMRDVEPLIRLLERTGPWLVVHGHKHRAHVMYAQGSAASATIFSAGSLASQAYGQLSSTSPKNQAYVLRFASESTMDEVDLDLAVRFEAWNWRPAQGWRRAGSTDMLPGRGGFGARIHPKRLAKAIAAALSGEVGRLTTAELLAIEPKLEYVSPDDHELLVQELTDKHEVVCTRSEHGELFQVDKKVELGVIATDGAELADASTVDTPVEGEES